MIIIIKHIHRKKFKIHIYRIWAIFTPIDDNNDDDDRFIQTHGTIIVYKLIGQSKGFLFCFWFCCCWMRIFRIHSFLYILFYLIEKKISTKKALNWIECVEKTNIKCVCLCVYVENESRITNQMMMMIKLEIDWLLFDTILL